MSKPIDTNSPDYLAGVRAGRLSFRLSVYAGFVGPRHAVAYNMPLPALANMQWWGGPMELGLYRLLVVDTMPEFETYPDEADRDWFDSCKLPGA